MSAKVMRRTTGSILPETDVIVVPSRLISGIGAGHCSRRVDLGQFVGDGSTYSFVMRGLDPRIHHLHEEDGLPGHRARRRAEPVIGPRFARTRWRFRPAMTIEKLSHPSPAPARRCAGTGARSRGQAPA